MDTKQLKLLIPDIDLEALYASSTSPLIEAVLHDLNVATRELTKCEQDAGMQRQWKQTRNELLAEIRRLVRVEEET